MTSTRPWSTRTPRRVIVADVAGAFENDSLVNCAAHVCDWTWFALGDVHANTAGYGGIAEAFEQVLP